MNKAIEEHRQFNQSNSIKDLRLLNRIISNQINRELKFYGHDALGVRHLSIFENLNEAQANIITLANRAGITKQAMSKLVKEAAEAGYIAVKSDKNDARVQLVSYTDKGLIFLRDMQTVFSTWKKRIISSNILSEAELEATNIGLKRILKEVEALQPKGKTHDYLEDNP